MNPTREIRVVAYLAGEFAKAAFARVGLVVETDDRWLLVGRWMDGWPQGSSLPDADLEALVAGGEATRCDVGLPARGAPWAWVLGQALGAETENFLRDVGDGLLCRLDRPDGTVVAFVDERRAGWVRAKWGMKALESARAALADGKGAEALQWARIGWLVTRDLTPRHVAALVLAHELVGQRDRGEGLRAMERNSRGAAFDEEVGAELADLRRDRPGLPPWHGPVRAPRWRAEAAKLRKLELEAA